MTERQAFGVLLMAYGGPLSLDEVEPYYRHILKGRQPSPEMLGALIKRYEAIGGRSPLPDITFSVARQLTQKIKEDPTLSPGFQGVFVGMKHSSPFIRDAVKEMSDRVQKAMGVVLAPHYSRRSIGEYLHYTISALQELGNPFSITFVLSWATHPDLISLLASLIEEKLNSWTDGKPHLLFTAHSLPETILAEGDPYPDELIATCKEIVKKWNDLDWSFAYQSASGENWLGPDILECLAELKNRQVRSVLVAPIGFLSQHLEVLYDIDIEAKEEADRLGLHLDRIRMPDDDPMLISALHAIVREAGTGCSDHLALWISDSGIDPTEAVKRIRMKTKHQ
ncbi:MAG: ferrochelatase [Armatimonadetes bacterium]|nr:ferrochelatase [Armatimonadota bacterium]MDW8123118.1 ferrochelatase [Armatimonadota bacterium]